MFLQINILEAGKDGKPKPVATAIAPLDNLSKQAQGPMQADNWLKTVNSLNLAALSLLSKLTDDYFKHSGKGDKITDEETGRSIIQKIWDGFSQDHLILSSITRVESLHENPAKRICIEYLERNPATETEQS